MNEAFQAPNILIFGRRGNYVGPSMGRRGANRKLYLQWKSNPIFFLCLYISFHFHFFLHLSFSFPYNILILIAVFISSPPHMCGYSASNLVKVVQILAAYSGATSLNLLLHVSNHSELCTLYSFHSNGCDGIYFLEASGKQGRKA